MISQQNDNYPIITDEWIRSYNLLCLLIRNNIHLLSDEVYESAKRYLQFEISLNYQKPFVDNYICLDGSSDYFLAKIIRELDKHKENLNIPTNYNKNGITLFYNNVEGWCSDDLFYSIEWIIDIYGLKGDCYYTNCSYNNQELYDRYLLLKNKPRKLKKLFFKFGFSYIHDKELWFSKPTVPIHEMQPTQKKLYCSLNWNGRPSRFGLIAYLNYKNLIEDGILTSPGLNRFSYNNEEDFNLLKKESNIFFNLDKENELILNKLSNIKNKYPFKVDDRSIVTDTDSVLFDTVLKAPIWNARVNTLYEIISETFYNGEIFFSEKTLNPIIIKKPFLLLSSYKSLYALQQLGFKTFHEFIDESYDKEENGVERLKKVVEEICKLKYMRINDSKKFYELYQYMNDILEYNYNHFCNELKW